MEVLAELKLLLNDPSLEVAEQLQSLWSGYGEIIRCKSVQYQKDYIVKVIAPADADKHPRGWNTSTSHQRKVTSYQIETCFYQHYAALTDHHNKVPKLIASKVSDSVSLLVMEDLDALGYNIRKDFATWHDLVVAIRWLAYFHARFMGNAATGLWPVATYWHLATRKDELTAMPNCDYKTHAAAIDLALNQAKYQTLVHGDAKFENMCFHANGNDIAAVDFQYVGRGSGVKDLAYLVGSCLHEQQLFEFDDLILPEYLKQLKTALAHYQVTVDFTELSAETTKLYPVAWADFYRFLLGWNPQSWKICHYMKTKAAAGLTDLQA
ncbi:MAG: phosphotransferase [Thalassotalea sp.]